MLRVKVLLRRTESANERKIKIGDLVLNYDQMSVTKKDKVYFSAQKEFMLLYKLLSTPNTIFTRQELIEEITGNGTLEVGTTEQRGFIIDNVYYSENQGDIHFASYYPENYDEARDYAIYFALPGWEGLYFQGVGANMGEPYPYEAQKYVSDMIIISPQLDDWGEESADDAIALVEYFLSHYNIDESRVYISGASGGGETLSLVLGKRPELFTSALFISSQWDGDLNVLANAKTPLYIVIGENDSYYGSTRAINAYNSLHSIFMKVRD